MGLQIAIGDAKSIGPGLWSAKVSPLDVKRLGNSQLAVGSRSIVGVWKPAYELATRRLLIEPAQATVFNVGDTDEVFVIDLGAPEGHADRKVVGKLDQESALNLGNDDLSFLAACRREKLPEHLIVAAEQILKTVRSRYQGQMKEGKARKWVNYPDNFLALVIQPRDESFAIHVWGEPQRFQPGKLEIKRDRASYSRFKLESSGQLADALRVIMESARLSTGR
jgi:hypothetical protein